MRREEQRDRIAPIVSATTQTQTPTLRKQVRTCWTRYQCSIQAIRIDNGCIRFTGAVGSKLHYPGQWVSRARMRGRETSREFSVPLLIRQGHQICRTKPDTMVLISHQLIVLVGRHFKDLLKSNMYLHEMIRFDSPPQYNSFLCLTTLLFKIFRQFNRFIHFWSAPSCRSPTLLKITTLLLILLLLHSLICLRRLSISHLLYTPAVPDESCRLSDAYTAVYTCACAWTAADKTMPSGNVSMFATSIYTGVYFKHPCYRYLPIETQHHNAWINRTRDAYCT